MQRKICVLSWKVCLGSYFILRYIEPYADNCHMCELDALGVRLGTLCLLFTVVTQTEETFSCAERQWTPFSLSTLAFLPRFISVIAVHNPALSVSRIQALSVASTRCFEYCICVAETGHRIVGDLLYSIRYFEIYFDIVVDMQVYKVVYLYVLLLRGCCMA
jgi:hypothetical protein